MPEPIVLKPIFDDSEIVRGWKVSVEGAERASDAAGEYNDIIKEVTKTVGTDLVNATNKQSKAAIDAAKAVRKEKTEVKGLTAERTGLLREYIATRKELKNQILNINILGTSIGQLVAVWKSLIAVSNLYIKVLGRTRVALIATGIGAFVVVLGSLFSFLTKTTEGSEFLNRKLAAMKGFVKPLIDLWLRFGKAYFEAITKPRKFFNELVDKLKNFSLKNLVNGFKELGAEMRETAKQAEAVTKARQDLTREEVKLQSELKKTRAEVERLKKISEDTTKSIEERKQAAIAANKIELEGFKEREGVLMRNLEIVKQEVALTNDPKSIENLKKIAEAELELADIREDSFGKQTELQNTLNALTQEQIRLVQELRNQYDELNQQLIDQLTALDLEEADPITRLNIQRRLALQALDEQRSALIELAKKLGQPLDEINSKFDRLITATIKRFDEEIEKVDKKIANLAGVKRPVEPIEIPIEIAPVPEESNKDKIRKGLESLLLSEDVQQALLGFEDFLGDGFADAFNSFIDSAVTIIENSGLEDQIAGVFELFASGVELFSAGTDQQIEDLERLNEAREENIRRLEDQLEREQERKEKGLSRSAEGLQAQLDAEIAARDEANQKLQELRKKEIQNELKANLARTASEYGVAIAKKYTAHSGIPFAGIALAAGFVATMIAQIKAANAQIRSITKLYKGGRVSDVLGPTRTSGFVKRGGKSDKPGMQQGYAVVDADTGEDTGLRLGGDEMVMNEGVSNQYEDFLRGLNTGKFYDNLPGPSSSVVTKKQEKTARKAYRRSVSREESKSSKRLEREMQTLNKKFDDLLTLQNLDNLVIEDEVVTFDKKKLTKSTSAIKARRKLG